MNIFWSVACASDSSSSGNPPEQFLVRYSSEKHSIGRVRASSDEMDEASRVSGGEECWERERWPGDGFALGDNVKTEEEVVLHAWVEQTAIEEPRWEESKNDPVASDSRTEADESMQSSIPTGEVTRRGGRERAKRTTSAGVTSSSGYPGVSWNRRMGAWLAFFYDAESRRSRTFHPKYYDFDVETARLAAIEFMKTVENRERPKRSSKSMDTSTMGPRKRSSPPQKSRARATQSSATEPVSDTADTSTSFVVPLTQTLLTDTSECLTESHSTASDSLLCAASQSLGHESSGSTLPSNEPQEWGSSSSATCEGWTPSYAVKCEPQQAEGVEESCTNKDIDEQYSESFQLMNSGSFPHIETKHAEAMGGNCLLCASGEGTHDEQLESTDDAAGDFATESTSRHSHGDYESPQLPDVQGEVRRETWPAPSESGNMMRQETKVEDTVSNSSTYTPSSSRVTVAGSNATGEEQEMEEDSCQDGDRGSRRAAGLSRSGSDFLSELMPRAEASSPCVNEDQKKMSESLLRSYSTDSVSYPNHTPEFFPLQSMSWAELSGDIGGDGRQETALHDSGNDSTGHEATSPDQLPAWLAADIASSGDAVASAGGNLHRAVLDRRGSWRGLARLRSQDSISAFMGGRADLMFTGLDGIRPMSGGLSRSGSMMCIQDQSITPLLMNLKTEYRDDGPLRKVPSGPFGKIGSDGFPGYLSARGGASPMADHRKSGSFKSVSTCLASDSPALENVIWDGSGEPQHYASCSACP